MYLLDTSSIIHAWDHYPIKQFPPLWVWMEKQIADKQIVMAEVAFDEVTNKSKECKVWLKGTDIIRLPMSNAIRVTASRIKSVLGIQDDNYHPDGVGENDLFIVATAQCHQLHLVSNEAKQPRLPRDMRRYKIPAVCGLAAVRVPCISFIAYLKDHPDVIFE